MSLLGGKKGQNTSDARLNGMTINQSTYGTCIPLLYGTSRVPMHLLWYGNFVATPHTTQNSGGKGGGGGGSSTTFTYSASMIMGLAEGPANSIGNVYQDKAVTTLAALGFTFFNGGAGAAPWTYLTTNFPSQAIGYERFSYVAVANYALGSSASLPNFTYELTGFVPFNVSGSIVDALPSTVILDYMTDANHGANFPYFTGIDTPGSSAFRTYCLAMGFFLSPYEDQQRSAMDFAKEIFQICNSNAFVSAGVVKVVPYCDATVTGTNGTYTPNLTPLFAFTDDDYLVGSQNSAGDPVVVSRLPLAQTYNVVRVEFLDRSNAYNTAISEASDAQDIALNGTRVMSTMTFHSITTASVARTVAQLILQRQLYIRTTYTFCVRPDYCLLEPMDLVSITDTGLGLVNKLVRVVQVEDDENDSITLTCEDMLVGTASAPQFNWQAVQGYNANYAVAPPSVGTPLIISAPPLLVSADGGYEMWVWADQGAPGSWGGADVYCSLDNVSYIYMGTINGAGRYGTLTAALANATDPDTTDTLSIQLTNPSTTLLQIASGTAADFNNMRTLIYVDGEIMAFQNASLTALGSYNLTNLRRGLYGSVANAHASGSNFGRIDGTIFRVPFDIGMMGQTLYFKFCSFNIYQKQYQSLASVTAYSKVLANRNAGALEQSALNLVASAGVVLSGDAAFKSTTANNAWDASLYSVDSYTTCSASCYAGNIDSTTQFMLGLTVNPSASNSYTNLNYAFFANSSGALSIYELGSSVLTGLTFTTSTLLNIVYDGKHVGYYVNGVLVRSVPVSGLTLFLQICFGVPGTSVYGIDFYRGTVATQPFTIKCLNANTAGTGTSVAPTGSGANAQFGLRTFTSTESINGGSMLSFQVNVMGAMQIGFATSQALGASILAGWYPHPDSGVLDTVFNGAGAAGYTSSTQATASDILQITYDNQNFRWYRNGTLVLTQFSPNAGPLFLSGDFFYTSGGNYFNIAFLPWASATPQMFTARGPIEFSDTSVHKLSTGSFAWTDADAVSIQGFKQCHIVWKAAAVIDAFIGLCGSYPASPAFANAIAAFDFAGSGNATIYESGTAIAVTVPYTSTDLFAITYDGANIAYYKNGGLLRSVSYAGQTLFGYIDIFTPNGVLNSVEFGAGSVVPLLDTAQIGGNAVSQIVSNFSASTVTNNSTVSGTQVETTVITAPTIVTSGAPVAIDAMTVISWADSGSASPSVALLSVYRDGVILTSSQFDGTSYIASRAVSPAIPVTLSVTDTPSAGSHVYTLHYSGKSGGTTGSVQASMINNFIKVREIKK